MAKVYIFYVGVLAGKIPFGFEHCKVGCKEKYLFFSFNRLTNVFLMPNTSGHLFVFTAKVI